MTWAKYGTEYFDQLASALVEAGVPEDLEDACVRTASEAHHFMFSSITPEDVERNRISFRKRFLARATSCPRRDEAARMLVSVGLWRDTGDHYEIVHGRMDIKSGVMAQEKKRASDRRAQAAARARKRRQDEPAP